MIFFVCGCHFLPPYYVIRRNWDIDTWGCLFNICYSISRIKAMLTTLLQLNRCSPCPVKDHDISIQWYLFKNVVVLKKYDEFPEKYDVSNFPRVFVSSRGDMAFQDYLGCFAEVPRSHPALRSSRLLSITSRYISISIMFCFILVLLKQYKPELFEQYENNINSKRITFEIVEDHVLINQLKHHSSSLSPSPFPF